MKITVTALTAILLAGCVHPGKAQVTTQGAVNTTVVMETSAGAVEIELLGEQAPVSVSNFLAYVDAGFYDQTVFHRVIPGFMIQGGGFETNLHQKAVRPPIKNEAGNGLKNNRGAVAMARTMVVDSATAQFFINLKNNDFLNHGARDFGYAVFARVTAGMEVVDRIAAVETTTKNGMGNVPAEAVVILSVRRK